MWSLFEQGELHAETALTGMFETDTSAVDADGVLEVIDDAREEAIRRELGREAG
jgi:RIO kinase 1